MALAHTGRVAFRRTAVVLLLLTAGCSGGGSGPGTAADRTYVREMLPHHQRALEVGRLAQQQGSDPRVRAFGDRILAEQTPEEQRLAGWVDVLGAHPDPAHDRHAAAGYVDDAALARLRSESGAVFDRDVLLSSAGSEEGAVTMSRAELAGGTYPPARTLATSITGAENGEIPELRALAAALPGG